MDFSRQLAVHYFVILRVMTFDRQRASGQLDLKVTNFFSE